MATAPSPDTTPAAPVEAAPAAPVAPAVAENTTNNADDVDNIMSVFGFGGDEQPPLPNFGTETEQTTPPAPEAQPPAPVVTPPAAAAPTPAAPAAAAPAPVPPLPGLQEPAVDTAALELASLKAQVQALTAALENKPAVPGTSASPTTPEPLVKPEELNYRLQIPPEVLNAVFNEDATVAANGMHHLINTLAAVIHRNVLTAARQDLGTFRNELQQSTAYDTQAQAREAAQAEYYKDFPAHNNPHIKILVAAEAQKLGVEFPNIPWGEQFKNALGARVNNVLATLNGGVTPAAPAPTTPQGLSPTAPVQTKPPAKPAGFMPVAPSGGIPAFENDQDIIASTFSFGS